MIIDKLTWKQQTWEELTRDELHQILKLRSDIFVLEQQDPYGDVDGWDPKAIHFSAFIGDELVAYSRLFLPGLKREEAVGGRICVRKSYRGNGVSIELLMQRMRYLHKVAPDADLYTYSQTYWIRRVLAMGAVPISSPMSKSRIEHVELIMRSDKIKEIVNAAA